MDCQKEIQRRQEELDVDVSTLRLLMSQTDAWGKEIQADVIDQCTKNLKEAIMHKSKVAKCVLDELSMLDQLKIGLGLGRGSFDYAWDSATRRGRGSAQHGKSNQNSLENELSYIATECVDTLSSRAQTQGNASIEYLGKRPAIIGSSSKSGSDANGISRMVGSVSIPKFRRLKELQPSVISTVRNFTSNLPNDSQSSDQLYASLQRTALLSSALVSSSAVPATLTLLEMLDATTGMSASAALAVLGCISLPLGNRSVASSFESEWISNAAQLETDTSKLFEDALNQIRSDLSESIAPYSRYVSSEGDWLKDLAQELEKGISNAHSLRSKINKACQ